MLQNIEPAALDDVLFEQLDYLLDHGACEVAGCRDCIRLRIVTAALMEPFTQPERRGLPVLVLDENGCVIGKRWA